MPNDFRFGVSLRATGSQSQIADVARRAEDLGFDVLNVPDHLGAAAPFPTLTAVAAATSTLRVGTFVLNAGFYKPALLARDASALWDLSEGRFDLGLGAGYVREEFDAAELPFPSARERIDYLRHTTEYLNEHAPDIPILIAGNGDRLLTVAAQTADIVGLTGGDHVEGDPLAERISFLRKAAGERFDDLELNIAITAMPAPGTEMPILNVPRHFLPGLSDDELLRHPGVLSGSVSAMADRIRGLRDTYGITYIIVQIAHAEAFGKVIAELR
ncbi:MULTISPECIES: LLM class F420-dependent oxidoreductase [Mycolicibacterium]|uniref:Luciferase family protein n=1 Tax=Mycolicibacterium senegalense TaxID=1796 RepID=A0A378SZZ9_9MYCO|nr:MULTISPECIES: LLM class F420-dependent oxidoreductase [Mycolicibacterium]MCV7334144.1 LLM class F420-dependent oxidoreductase [Mycolicibacterium senegalense]MDR7292197.1 putative F420-dependent oxidoreductase [Mycolicibacterium senegalense]QZA23591.1 LLM class F420-dependent oxidoreductase [Mycolicibacterium senegalense]CDP88586.1 luciferase family protein [Mycolicibacterium farcinogenes]STZ52747.1 Luciferase family protein [Mycolicibacterium senegalense]